MIFATNESTRAAFVATNHHVIEGASSITVSLNDGQTFSGSVEGWDAQRDIAVVRICCNQDFSQLDFADPEQIRPGETVYAIGYPLGSDSILVTQGIISGLQFDPTADRHEIQTDAAINSGNSGGPLISTTGEILGLATYVIRSVGGAASVEGFGFAISSATLQPSLAQLQGGATVAAPTPTPNPSVSGGTFTHPDYGYLLKIPDNWILDASDPDTVWVYEGDTFAYVGVGVTPIDESRYETTSDYVQDWTVRAADEWSNYELISELVISRRSTGSLRDVGGYEFRYSYEYDGEHLESLEQWFVFEGHLYTVLITAPSIIWTDRDYVEVINQLKQVGFSFRPLATKSLPSTPTPIPTPSPWQLGRADTCELNPEHAPLWYDRDRREYVESFDDEIQTTQGRIGTSPYHARVPNGYVEAEFLFIDGNSFGFEFRRHSDDRVTVNDGYAADYLVIEKTGSRWEWRHQVRNRFTSSLGFEDTLVDRGTLTNVRTGVRVWNKLGLYFNRSEGRVFFNDQVITTLRLDEVDDDVSYMTRAISGLYTGDPLIDQPVRNARILCPW